MTDDATKRCSACGEVKPLAAFSKRSEGGFRAQCKGCLNAQRRSSYPDRRGRINAQRKATYPDRRERILAEVRDYKRRNPERVRESQKNWRNENHEHLREAGRKRNADLRAQVLGHYGTACACCGTAERLSIDHINGDGRQHREELFGDPQRGGTGTRFYTWLISQGFPDGYQVLCLPCNISKGSGKRCRLRHD